MVKRILTTAAALGLLAAGLGAGTGSGGQGASRLAEKEALCGANLHTETLVVEVTSSGCTEAEDFVFVLDRVGPSETDALMIRVEPDYCLGPEHTVTLAFDRAEIGLEAATKVNLLNPWRGDCGPRW